MVLYVCAYIVFKNYGNDEHTRLIYTSYVHILILITQDLLSHTTSSYTFTTCFNTFGPSVAVSLSSFQSKTLGQAFLMKEQCHFYCVPCCVMSIDQNVGSKLATIVYVRCDHDNLNSSVRNSSTVSNTSLLLQIVTRLLYVTNLHGLA